MSLIRARYRAVNTIMNLPRGGFVGLLDLFPNAAAAYSLRKLRAAYSGSAVRVRRSSDNTEQDIGFTTQGELDTTSLLSFVNEDVVVYTSDFTSTENLSEFNGTGAAAQSVGGVDDAYKFTLSGGNVQHTVFVSTSVLEIGKSFTIVFDYYIPSGQTLSSIVFDNLGGSWAISGSLNVTDNWTTETINFTADGTRPRWWAGAFGANVNADGDVFYLKNIVVTQTTADGLVSTWYDQSLSNDATQSTAAAQPKIVSGGSLVTEGSKPAVDFDGVDDELVIAASQSKFNQLHDGSNSTIIAVSTFSANARILGNDASSSSNIGFDLGYTSDIAHFIREGSGAANRPVVNIGGGVYSTNNQYLLFVDVDADNATAANRSSIYIDSGTPIKNNTSTASPSASDATFDLSIGSAGNNILNNNGKTQEIILYPSDQSSNRTGIEANINTFYSIYP